MGGIIESGSSNLASFIPRNKKIMLALGSKQRKPKYSLFIVIFFFFARKVLSPPHLRENIPHAPENYYKIVTDLVGDPTSVENAPLLWLLKTTAGHMKSPRRRKKKRKKKKRTSEHENNPRRYIISRQKERSFFFFF